MATLTRSSCPALWQGRQMLPEEHHAAKELMRVARDTFLEVAADLEVLLPHALD